MDHPISPLAFGRIDAIELSPLRGLARIIKGGMNGRAIEAHPRAFGVQVMVHRPTAKPAHWIKPIARCVNRNFIYCHTCT